MCIKFSSSGFPFGLFVVIYLVVYLDRDGLEYLSNLLITNSKAVILEEFT